MKKLIFRVFIPVILLLLSLLLVSGVVHQDLEAGEKKGKYLYDENGLKVGCESPGTDCTWWY